MTPAEAIIDALETVADRHETRGRSGYSYREPSAREVAEDVADVYVAEALRDVAQEFALALGIER